MKKLITPLLLLPSLAFGYTNSVTALSDAKCYDTAPRAGINIKVINLSSNPTSVKLEMTTQTGVPASNTNYKFRLNNGDHSYASFTPDTAISIPANSGRYMYMEYTYDLKSSGATGANNSCNDLPEMIKVTHMDVNSQVVVSGYSTTASNLKFDLKFNDGKPF